MHQENDEDKYAVKAFVEGIKCDNYNHNILLHLAISCTNELEENQAITFLRMWLNTKYPELEEQLNKIPRADFTYSAIADETSSIMNIMENMFKLNKSLELCMALGVLKFIDKNYDEASEYFREGINISPEDGTMWNKLGATYANSGRNDKALECYKKAL